MSAEETVFTRPLAGQSLPREETRALHEQELAPPEAPATHLTALKARVQKIAAKLNEGTYFDYPIKRWDGLLVVRYKPINDRVVSDITKSMLDVKSSTYLDLHAKLLSLFCSGVYFRDDTGELVSADIGSPNLEAPAFDKRLADSLDIPFLLSEKLVLQLYGVDTPGEVTSTYQALERDSGFGRADEIRASRLNF